MGTWTGIGTGKAGGGLPALEILHGSVVSSSYRRRRRGHLNVPVLPFPFMALRISNFGY